MTNKTKVLIAGIGGASLGTEILKSLLLAGGYEIYGCDVSPLAFGHYQESSVKTFLADKGDYVKSISKICHDVGVHYVVPGAEQTTILLTSARKRLLEDGVKIVANGSEVVRKFSDKSETFSFLAEMGFSVPRTKIIEDPSQLEGFPFPCIIKPSSASGGSEFVFLAEDIGEASLCARQLLKNGKRPLAQEYIPHTEGEFTVGVLCLPHGELVGSVAMKRVFQNKLSISLKTEKALISSGYSQGLIDEFAEIRKMAESIALVANSTGPLNVQGRLYDGTFYPFEINPRFSASTYLRALAGFNEVDIYLRGLTGKKWSLAPLRKGYYLRSLSEICVPPQRVMA
jgi:carbamoyl-phosphate synthase large subunit